MKVALITDLHFGARQDNLAFDNYFRKFYTEVFFPELEKRDIKVIFDLGDTFDRRKYINFNTLNSCKEYFFDEIAKRGMDLHMIPGNHDTYFKNTNAVNSPELLVSKEYENLYLYQEPEEVNIDGTNILMMPWICGENYERSINKIENTNAGICFGHFEFEGYDMLPGMVNTHGMDPSIFSNFELVVSGHFHHRHTRGNITYMGNPYEITWSDYGDTRGFAIFDTTSRELQYINNPLRLFHKIYYDDSIPEKCVANSYDVSKLSGCAVKLIVTKKTDFAKFDNFVDSIYNVNPIEFKILEDFTEFEEEAIGDDIDLEDTMTLLKEYVENVTTDLDKDRIKSLLQALYVEAQDVE